MLMIAEECNNYDQKGIVLRAGLQIFFLIKQSVIANTGLKNNSKKFNRAYRSKQKKLVNPTYWIEEYKRKILSIYVIKNSKHYLV